MSGAIVIDLDDPTPPYEQVRRAVVRLIAEGELVIGDRLPSVRQLAGDLGVAAGTIARAYRELEAAGIVETGRARGTRVKAAGTELVTSGPDPLEPSAVDLIALARRHGRSLDDVCALVVKLW